MVGELERFRKRLRGKDKEKDEPRFKVREWRAIVLLVAAFVWCVGSTYWKDFRVVDDVRLAVGLDWPGIEVRDPKHASIFVSQTLTFTNAGNRAKAVNGAELVLELPAEQRSLDCSYGWAREAGGCRGPHDIPNQGRRSPFSSTLFTAPVGT
jgi:hypothetical protein